MLGLVGIESRRYRRFENSRRDGSQLKRGLPDGPPGFQSTHYRKPPAVRAVELTVFAGNDWLRAQRHSHIKVTPHFHTIKIRRCDADNRKGMPVDQQRLADRGVLARKGVLPE